MPFRIVHSKQNARLKELRRALAHPPRSGSGAPAQLAGIEGPILLREALRAGLKIETVFVAQGLEGMLADVPLPAETEVLLLPEELLIGSLTTENPQPVAALVQPFDWIWRDLLEGAIDGAASISPLIVVLAGLQDPGNLGTILRSAEAFGATGVISLPGTVSPWNPKAVRASAGSIFRVPFVETAADECLTQLRAAGLRILTTAVHGAESSTISNLTGPTALLIGNEGNGVPADLASRCDGAITIPTPGAVESLNAAVAASVLLYEAARQRAAHHNPVARARPTSTQRGAR
jgi:TrmH family RNA methyltransferase